LHVPSALFFDMGVFALVLGATMLILTGLAHQSVRSHRWSEEQAERAAEARATEARAAAAAASTVEQPA
jgi:multicomponent K+:H+ antiporter subunit A